jgi:hypothetical protein
MQNIKDILDRLKSLRVEKELRQDHKKVLGSAEPPGVRKEQGAILITTESGCLRRYGKELTCQPVAHGRQEELLLFFRPLRRRKHFCAIELVSRELRQKHHTCNLRIRKSNGLQPALRNNSLNDSNRPAVRYFTSSNAQYSV